MKAKNFLKISAGLISGLLFLMLTLNGCSKQDEPISASADELTNQEAILDYSFTDDLLKSGSCCIDTFPYETLSPEETEALLVMREEEFLAHDVYIALSQLYTKPIFRNIARSEQRHTDAVKMLIDKYGLPDPAANHITGTFTNPDLQALYNSLVALGSTSLMNGLIVGATIEDLDIYDLINYLTITDNQDMTFVFNNLMRGSRNHLRSFYANIRFYGGSYTPQYLTQAQFDAIVNSKHERGQGNCSCL